MDRKRIADVIRKWPQIFDAAVERVLNSPDPSVRNNFFLGLSLHDWHPMFYPRELQYLGGHLLGDPGSNKTAVGISSLSTQMIAARDMSVVFGDLKGDPMLFERARIEAANAGLPFYWYTLVPGRSSYVFNPLDQWHLKGLTVTQLVQQLLTALGLIYADIYGASYYSAMTESHLTRMLERFGPVIHSFVDLYRYCSDRAANRGFGSPKEWENSQHLHAVLYRLTKVFPLNATAGDFGNDQRPIENAIQAVDVLTRPCVVYLFLPSLLEAVTARCLVKLFLFALIAAGTLLKLQGSPTIGVAVFLDEFHNLISTNIDTVLVQARDLKIGCFLAHQNLEQLKLGRDQDFTHVVQTASAYKHIFRASDLATRKFISDSSGEGIYTSLSWTQDYPPGGLAASSDFVARDGGRLHPAFALSHELFGPRPVNIQERISPLFTPNDIMQISAEQFTSLVNFSSNTDYARYDGRWTPIISGYHITQDEYRDARQAAWPAPDPSCVMVPFGNQSARELPKNPAVTSPPGEMDHIDARVQAGLQKGARRIPGELSLEE